MHKTVLALLIAAPLVAQQPAAPFDFSIKNIMRGPELYGRPPENIRWSADNGWIYFDWVEAGKDWREKPAPYRVRAVAGAKPERLTIAQMDSAGPLITIGTLSPDRRRSAVAWNGDIYIVDTQSAIVRRITKTVAAESNPTFSTNGRTIYFVRDNNAFAFDLASGLVSQLTDIRSGVAPTDSASSDSTQRGRLAQQQRDLFSTVRDMVLADSVAKREQRARDSLRPPPTYVGKNRRIVSVDIAPTGETVLITLRIPPSNPRQAEVQYFVTESGYSEPRKVRTKVGDAQERTAVLIANINTGKPTQLKLFAADSLLSDISFAGWNSDGTRAALFAFRADNKERILYTVSASGALTTIESLHDTAWVDGPCVTCAGWIGNTSRLWYVSEKTGFAHLYSALSTGQDVRALTAGRWEVRNVKLSRNGDEFLLTTNEPSPFEEQFYRMPVNGGARTRITTTSGGHAAVVSPNGALVADLYSYVNRPPDLYLLTNRPGALATQLTQSASAEWLRGPWITPEIVMIPASDGAKVPAHIYRPADMGAQPNGAAVIFVHGAGYLHNVGNFWSQYPREYMFNQYLAKQGYVVLDLDYRASDGYGRDWRTAIYRWMGGRDLQDQVDASKYLTATYNVPPKRIGIYGGSYGGFITLMALFTEPQHFGAGAALRSVTDWAHYNHGYTSNILNLPETDTLAYRRSSPIYFAEGLQAPLLMAHGMVDNNVHYQDIVRLTQRLIELGKTDWELASYPVEDHGFVRPSSWTDEYTRIFKLFERTIAKP